MSFNQQQTQLVKMMSLIVNLLQAVKREMRKDQQAEKHI